MILKLSAVGDPAPQGSDQRELWELPKLEGTPSRNKTRQCPPLRYCYSWSSHCLEHWSNNLSFPSPQIITWILHACSPSGPVFLKVDSEDHLRNVYTQIPTIYPPPSPLLNKSLWNWDPRIFMSNKLPRGFSWTLPANPCGLIFKCLHWSLFSKSLAFQIMYVCM